jgi:hypothetical protein
MQLRSTAHVLDSLYREPSTDAMHSICMYLSEMRGWLAVTINKGAVDLAHSTCYVNHRSKHYSPSSHKGSSFVKPNE